MNTSRFKLITPSALNPMEMSIEKDEGISLEPNVWMAREL